jgi:hypothetical protein
MSLSKRNKFNDYYNSSRLAKHLAWLFRQIWLFIWLFQTFPPKRKHSSTVTKRKSNVFDFVNDYMAGFQPVRSVDCADCCLLLLCAEC